MSNTHLKLNMSKNKLFIFHHAFHLYPPRPVPLDSFFSQDMTVPHPFSHSGHNPESHPWLCSFSHTSLLICQWITSILPSNASRIHPLLNHSHSSHLNPSHSHLIVERPPRSPCFCLFPMAAKMFPLKHIRPYHHLYSAKTFCWQHILLILKAQNLQWLLRPLFAFLTSAFLICSPHLLCSGCTLLFIVPQTKQTCSHLTAFALPLPSLECFP